MLLRRDEMQPHRDMTMTEFLFVMQKLLGHSPAHMYSFVSYLLLHQR